MHKIGQSEGFLGRQLGTLLNTGFTKYGKYIIGNVFTPLPKSVLIPLGLTATASATDAAIHKKRLDLVRMLWTEQSKQHC